MDKKKSIDEQVPKMPMDTRTGHPLDIYHQDVKGIERNQQSEYETTHDDVLRRLAKEQPGN